MCISHDFDLGMDLSIACPLAIKASGCFHMEINGNLHRKGVLSELYPVFNLNTEQSLI